MEPLHGERFTLLQHNEDDHRADFRNSTLVECGTGAIHVGAHSADVGALVPTPRDLQVIGSLNGGLVSRGKWLSFFRRIGLLGVGGLLGRGFLGKFLRGRELLLLSSRFLKVGHVDGRDAGKMLRNTNLFKPPSADTDAAQIHLTKLLVQILVIENLP